MIFLGGGSAKTLFSPAFDLLLVTGKYGCTSVSRRVRRITWESSLKNWELQIPCFEEFFWGGNTLGLVPASLPHALGYVCTFYAPASPPPILFHLLSSFRGCGASRRLNATNGIGIYVRCCFAPPSRRDLQGHFQSILPQESFEAIFASKIVFNFWGYFENTLLRLFFRNDLAR